MVFTEMRMFNTIMSALHALRLPRFTLISPSHVQPEVLQVADRMRQIVEERLGLPRIPVRWVRRVPCWWLRPWRRWVTRPSTPPHLRRSARFPAAFLAATRDVRLDFGGVFLPDLKMIVLERPPRVTPASLLELGAIMVQEARHAWQHREGWGATHSEEAREADADRFVFEEMPDVISQVARDQEPAKGMGGQEASA